MSAYLSSKTFLVKVMPIQASANVVKASLQAFGVNRQFRTSRAGLIPAGAGPG